jgi:hypothetical protein
MVSAPVLDSTAALADTEYPTVPAPFPVAPAVTLIQPPLAVTLHVHPAGAVTVTLPAPPSLPNVRLAGVIAIEQAGVGSVGDPLLLQLAMAALRTAATTTSFESLALMFTSGRLRAIVQPPGTDAGAETGRGVDAKASAAVRIPPQALPENR